MDLIAVLLLGNLLAVLNFYIFRHRGGGRVPDALNTLIHTQEQILASVDDILAGISELTSINDSLDAVFVQLQTLIEQSRVDPEKLQQALDLLTAQKERTKAAILANTPGSGGVSPS